MKKLALLLFCFLLANVAISQTTVKKATMGVAIDGHLEEEFWEITLPVNINSDGSDNIANFGLLWDENYLYVGVEVTDNLLCNGRRQAFYDDGVEICIDGNHDQTTDFDDNDLQLVKPIKSFWVQEMNLNFDNIVHQYKENATGYTMEFAIPWNSINTTPTAGNTVGFNLVVNDDDNAASDYNMPAQLIWAGDENYHASPQNWGSIVLSSQTAEFSTDYLALLSPNNGDFLINGKNTEIRWFSYGVDNVKIEYSTDNGANWVVITASTDASTGVFQWLAQAPASQEFLFKISDASNSAISDQSDAKNIVSAPLSTSDLLIPAQWQNYQWPYNAYFPISSNGINGHLGNGCGPSSLARILHCWKFPRRGSGALNFTDHYGNLWQADFENTTYNYDNMPNNLSESATEQEYTDVATLFLHAQVAMNDFYGTGTDLNNMGYAMSTYFNYKESQIAYMHDYTPAQWTQLLINEIDNGRSLLIQGMNLEYFGDWHSSNSIGGHWYHCDGYNENGEFHIIVGFGNYQYDGYYKIEEFPLFGYNVGILTGLEPNLQGKTLSLTQPNGGQTYTAGDQVEISWQSSDISNLQIEYTLDNGKNWIQIEAAADASAQSYLWTSPETNAEECKIRLTDTENINVYTQSQETFELMASQVALISPLGGESLVFDDIAPIKWQTTPVEKLDIAFSANNGNSWNSIVSNIDASQGQYEWTVPQTETNQALIKISDSNEESNFYVSDATFSIVPQNLEGGPYKTDDNTLLLLHAEGTLFNQSEFSDHPQAANGEVGFTANTVSTLGKAFYFHNSNPYLTIPHSDGLNLSDNWTIELWFKPETFKTGLQYFLWKPGDNDEYFSNYAMLISEYWGNELYALYFAGDTRFGVNTGFFPELNKWYHIAFIRNTANSSLKVIVRNQQRQIVNTSTIADNGNSPLTSSQNLRIGFNFNGSIDEIRISDIVRTFEPSTINNQMPSQNLIVSPNPASDFIQINHNEISDIQIFSLTGVCLISAKKIQPGTPLNVSGLKNGIYMLVVKNRNGFTTSKKLVIQK